MEYAIALRTIVTLMALYALWYFGFRVYALDKFRQKLFEIRGKLFLYAIENRLDFSGRAYTKMRDKVNGRIRFAHRFRLMDFLFMSKFVHDLGEQAKQIEHDFLSSIKSARKHNDILFLTDLDYEVEQATIHYFVRSSLPVYVAYGLIKILNFVADLVRRVHKRATRTKAFSREGVQKIVKPVFEVQMKEDEVERVIFGDWQ